jgi:hypothetical protein
MASMRLLASSFWMIAERWFRVVPGEVERRSQLRDGAVPAGLGEVLAKSPTSRRPAQAASAASP